MTSTDFAERILTFLQSADYRPRSASALASEMRLGADEQAEFQLACKTLAETGRIILGPKTGNVLVVPKRVIAGRFRGNRRGFGFVIPAVATPFGDLYIPADKSFGAMSGDIVTARAQKKGKRNGTMLYEGRVVAILERACSRIVGELRSQGGRWLVIPDGNTLHVPLQVGDPGAKNAKQGDQVVVEIIQYPEAGVEARGVILRVLGRRGGPGVDASSMIEQYQLPGEFDEEVLVEAREAARTDPADEGQGREDLREGTVVITIDPVSARDFDDAISISRNQDGTCELGVHIADVAHYIATGTRLDEEARERGNSVYLPGVVIPMIPEMLSNGVCSLQERQPRLTKSAFITYDAQGNVRSTRLANTMVSSTKRLTYQQAQRVLDGEPGRIAAKVVTLLGEMERLAKLIRARRLREGMLVLDLPEVELVFNDDGQVTDVTPADTGFTHTIIEMFMVEANEAVARTLANHKVAALRRIHEDPTAESWDNLRSFVRMLGHGIPEELDRGALQRLLTRMHGKPESFAVHLAALRSMQQAKYSPKHSGHYALASSDYCHFTSPIRRYPDLTIHRLIDAYLDGQCETPRREPTPACEQGLAKLGEHCSNRERRAESAERELKLVHVLRLLESRMGDVFDGVVTGITNFGLFVQLDRFLVDGLLRFESLPDDWWEVDPNRGAVLGERSGTRITLGDHLRVGIVRIDLPGRRVEVGLAGPLAETPGAKRVRTSGRDNKRTTSRRGGLPKNKHTARRKTGDGRTSSARSGRRSKRAR